MTGEVDTFVKLKNPYTFGVPVRGEGKFFGREEELQLIFDTLNNVPRGQKQDMVVLGPRRIGKSSLLYRLVDLLTPDEEFVPIYVDVQNIKPRKTRALFFKILQRVKEGYEQKNLLAALPSFKTLEPDRIPADLEFFTFDEDMSRLNNTIATQNLPRLVLMFDEVELLLDFGGQDTLDWFRSLIQSMLYTIFVVAGSERLYSLTQDYGSPFYNIFKTVELRPLTPNAARKLIEVPAKQIGLEISSAEVDKILHYTGNNPYFIQGFCQYLVEALNRQNRREVYPEDVNGVIQQSIDYFLAQFAYIWGGRSQVQRAILYALANSKYPQPAHALMENLPQLENLVRSRQERQAIFDDLVEQQILKVENGHYWFIVPLFVDWILSEVDDEEIIRLGIDTAEITKDVDLVAVRRSLSYAFDDAGLDALATDHFPVVYDRFSHGMTKNEKITLLLDYVRRSNQFDKLLALVDESHQALQSKRTTRPTVFISYSHQDEAEKDQLLSHLGVLPNVNVWSDDKIGPGTDWQQEIYTVMAQAKVAILLITAAFLSSDFIRGKELSELLKRHQNEGLIIFPVIAKASAWKTIDWLTKMDVRPKNGRPVWSDGGSHVDEDLAAIAEEIASIIKQEEQI